MDVLVADPQASAAVMPWAICDTALPLNLPTAMTMAVPDGADIAALAEEAIRDTDHASPQADGDVTVIRASGVIMPRVHPIYEAWGYAVSSESLATRIEQAVGTSKAVALLLDSPGGSAAGVLETSARIAAVSGGDVPVVAVADYLAASAAYWIAAACTAVVVSPSAQIGSVGVRMLRPGYARQLDAEGVDLDAIFRGEGKLDYVVWTELDGAGRERLQRSVDACYDDFTRSVSAGRGLPRRTVTDEWGAQLLTAQAAKQAGMADEVRTAAEVVQRLTTPGGRRRYMSMGAEAVERRPAVEAAEALGALESRLHYTPSV